MAGEMTSSELAERGRQEWPLHYAIADALGGEVKPFDVYQGPYVSIGPDPGAGVEPYHIPARLAGIVRLWIVSDDDGGLDPGYVHVYNEGADRSSCDFAWNDTVAAIEAAKEVLA